MTPPVRPAFRGLFVGAWTAGTATQVAVTVTVQNLTIQNTRAAGGAGAGSSAGAGGGGGAGLGAALFVANLSSVTLTNVNLATNTAAGGSGGASSGGTGNGSGSGGGGMGGHGGNSASPDTGGGGGGLGLGANGGTATGDGSTGGTLGGTGTILRSVNVNSGGTLAPGVSPGVINTGDLTLESGSTFTVELDSAVSFDQVNVTGQVTINGATLNVVLAPGFVPPLFTIFDIIDNDSNDQVTGQFAGLPDGATLSVGNVHFFINYFSGAGANNVRLTVIDVDPTFSKAFGAVTMPLNGVTSLSFTITNPNANANASFSDLRFTDNLPPGMKIVTPNGLTGSCGGGTITAVKDTTTIELDGANLGPSESCTFSVNVTATTVGPKNNQTEDLFFGEESSVAGAADSITVVAGPTILKQFGAASLLLNATTTLTITLGNANEENQLTGVTFTDTLPAGLIVATPNGLSTNCTGTVSAPAGGGTVSLTNGVLPTGSSCTITVTVRGATQGLKNNTTGPISSTEGGQGPASQASLVVIAPATILKQFGAPNISLNGTTTLTITISNPADNVTLTGLAFTDTFPAGLVVATPNGLSTTCNGAGNGDGDGHAAPGADRDGDGRDRMGVRVATVTCTRSDSLASGASYPPITLTVNVEPTASGSIVNTAIVSGGGDSNPANNTATDPTSLDATAVIPTLSTYAQAIFVLIVISIGLLMLRRRSAPR